jgi:hypothetical protein
MIKIADTVRSIVYSSEVARSALSEGYLNLSAYGKKIQREVSRRARKPVQVGTIVVALSRLSKTIEKAKQIVPPVEITSLSVKTGLAEIAFDKTKINRDKLQLLYQDKDFLSADFFTVTSGNTELAIVCPMQLQKAVRRHFGNQKPKLELANLAGLTLRFDETYINIPNQTFALIRPLALKRINIVEVISTFTELTVLLYEKDLQEAFATFTELLTKTR